MTIKELLEDLLTEFDEFDMQPMLPMPGDPIEKAKAWKHELEYVIKHLKTEIAREIFAEIERLIKITAFADCWSEGGFRDGIAELKKKYIGGQNDGRN